MPKKWLYGDKWERYPIERGQVHRFGPHVICCADIVRDTARIEALIKVRKIDMTYIDPPWNTGNINSFRTKAGYEDRDDFIPFITTLIDLVKFSGARVNYMEMGKQNINEVSSIISEAGFNVTHIFLITYYRVKPCYLIRYITGDYPTDIDSLIVDSMDDDITPFKAIETEEYHVESIADFCAGKGLTGRAVHEHDLKFFGTELNKRRLAWLCDFFSSMGYPWTKGG